MKTLPFAVHAEPSISYPEAMEAAIALLTFESKRGKGTGFILRKTEELGWASRFLWPMMAFPVELPDTAGDAAPDGYTVPGRKLLFFDLTGLTSSSIPAFHPREGLDLAEQAAGADMPVAEYTTLLERCRDALRQAKPPLAGAISAVKGLIKRSGLGEEVTGFLSGHQHIARDLLTHLAEQEPPEWYAPELAKSLTEEDAARVAEELADRIRAYVAQASRTEAALLQLQQGADVYPSQLADQREQISMTYSGQIDVLRPEVDRNIADFQRSLEERLNAIMMQYSSTSAAQEAEVSRASLEEDRFRSMGKGAEPQLAEARRARVEAQRKLDATNRERDTAVRQARDHFRSLIDQENEKINALVKARDRELAVLDAAEKKLETALRELTNTAGSAIQQDRKAAADLAGLAVDVGELPVDTGMPVEFGVPMYIARLDGPKVRYVVMPPQTIKRTRGIQDRVGGLVSGLMGGLTLPADVRTPRYESVLGRALNAALEGPANDGPAASVVASVNEGAASGNVLANPNYLSLALEGLDLLKEGGWLKDKQHEEQKQALHKMFNA